MSSAIRNTNSSNKNKAITKNSKISIEETIEMANSGTQTAKSQLPASKVPIYHEGRRMLSYQNILALALMLMLCGLANVEGLKCQMCGQYNEGVGSITPCLNYSLKNAHLYLKECNKKSEKFCVKYVSELSTVRDCATECVEKEIWETQTYCCKEDGCNGTANKEISIFLIAVPLIYFVLKTVLDAMKVRR